MMSNGIVLDLQEDLLKTNCDVISALRKALVISKKLKLDQMDKWINYELNGYKGCANDDIPEYRLIRGLLRANNPYNGWIPVALDEETEKRFCNQKIAISLVEIISLTCNSEANGGFLTMSLPGSQQGFINQMCNMPMPIEVALFLPKTAVKSIIEKVKNAMLEWTLKLEEDGILGEKMRFTGDEKKAAEALPQNINYFIGPTNYIVGSNNEINQVVGDNNQISFSYDEAQDIIDGTRRELEKDTLAFEDKESIMDIINEIDEKIKSKKKPSVIKSALMGLKDFAFSVGATVLTAFLQSKLGL